MKIDIRKIAKVFEGWADKIFCLVFPIVFIAGCVSMEESNRMQWDINTLRADLKEIKQKSKSIETQFPGQQKQFSELEETQRAAAKTASDLLIRIQYLTTEVQMLTGRFEEARFYAEKNAAELKETKEMLIAKMKQLDIMVGDLKKRLVESETTAVPKKEPKKNLAGVKGKKR